MRRYYEYFRCIPKTFIFNFRYFPLRIAIKLPVFISHRVILRKLSGTVKLEQIKTGIVKIGFGDPPLFDSNRERSVLYITGSLTFKGSAEFGPGCRIGVYGEMICGNNLAITGFSMISAKDRIVIGEDVMISWDVAMMDHDYHDLRDETHNVINPPKPIHIGNSVWVCFRVVVLKGCTIPDGVIISAGAIVAGSIEEKNIIIGNQSNLRTIKRNIYMKR
jgi:acetyltransferase-like isoleucine patch superfamily enzyme